MMRTLLLGDWGTKAIALVMAVLLWSYLYWQRTTPVEMSVPIEVRFNAPDVHSVQPIDAAGRPVGQVKLRITAERSLAAELENLDVRCKITLPESAFIGAEQGRHTVTLAKDNVTNLPGSATVRFLPSAEITVEYRKWVVSDPVPVSPGDVVEPPPRFRRGDIKIQPPAVRVRLPAGTPPPEFLTLPPINLSGQRASYWRTTRLQAPEGVELVDAEVAVDIEIFEEPQTKLLRPKLQVVWQQPDARVKLKEDPRKDVRVSLKGTREELELFTDESVLVVIVPQEWVESAVTAGEYIGVIKEGLLIHNDHVRLLKRDPPTREDFLDEIRIELERP